MIQIITRPSVGSPTMRSAVVLIGPAAPGFCGTRSWPRPASIASSKALSPACQRHQIRWSSRAERASLHFPKGLPVSRSRVWATVGGNMAVGLPRPALRCQDVGDAEVVVKQCQAGVSRRSIPAVPSSSQRPEAPNSRVSGVAAATGSKNSNEN